METKTWKKKKKKSSHTRLIVAYIIGHFEEEKGTK